jgi:hypothetical protein
MPLPRPLLALASALAAAGAALAAASCAGHITPLGPGQVMPPPRHLGSPITVQVMRVQPSNPTGGCPAGWVAASLPAGGRPLHAVAHAAPVAPKGAAAATAPSPLPPPPAPIACYRPAGTPVTITSAAVSTVLTYRPPPGQPKGPDLYGFIVAVPGAEIAAVTAAIRQAYDTGGAVGISVAGKLWQAPLVQRPFPGQRLQITLLSKIQAGQLHRILVPSG